MVPCDFLGICYLDYLNIFGDVMKLSKKLAITLIALINISASALVGGFSGQGSDINFDIMDFQEPNTVGIDIKLDGGNDSKYRSVFFNLNVDDYIAIFNTNQVVNGNKVRSGSIVSFSASGAVNDRKVRFETESLDDNDEVAQKEVTTITMKNGKASVNIEAYRRKQILFYVGKLKKVSETETVNLVINNDGVGLYGDNRGWPSGKVVSIEALLEAAANNSTSGLKAACEVECLE